MLFNMTGAASTNLTTKTITANGTYNASTDGADGYSSVTVDVSGGGGGVQTRAVTVPHSTTYYTNANMEFTQGAALVGVTVPVGTVIVGVGIMEPGASTSGVTQVAYYSRTMVYVYKVNPA